VPYKVLVDPYDEVIQKIRAGKLREIPLVRLAGTDYQLPSRFALLYEPADDEPRWRMVFEMADDGVPRCTSVHIDASPAGREIRSRDLRLSVEDGLELAARNLSFGSPRDVKDVLNGATLSAVRSARQAAKRKVTDEVLREVAAIYRANVDNNPTAAVAAHLGGVADRTARLWVRRARDAGHLGDAPRGKAGEV
jgi:hypothetical protein